MKKIYEKLGIKNLYINKELKLNNKENIKMNNQKLNEGGKSENN